MQYFNIYENNLISDLCRLKIGFVLITRYV